MAVVQYANDARMMVLVHRRIVFEQAGNHQYLDVRVEPG
jgi:hypothetical protein